MAAPPNGNVYAGNPQIWRQRALRLLLACAALMLFGSAGCGRVGVRLLPVDPVPYAGCMTTCDTVHGVLNCNGGTECTVSCETGYANCDADNSNGCEVSIMDSVDTCGSCTLACANAHGDALCAEGLCTPSCAAGFADCDSNPNNGCETSLSNVDNCGACGAACSNAHGTTRCDMAECNPSCDPGYDDCDGRPDNGCEASVLKDPKHCGSCSNTCNPDLEVCNNGSCELSPCSPGRGECDGNTAQFCETDLTSSDANCGFCGNACQADHGSAVCSDSACTLSGCDQDYADCDSMYENGCEVALTNSTNHCGSCDVACSNAHGTTSCMASTCAPTCASGYDDCDGMLVNGCETPLNTTTDCGMCGKSCPANGGTPICNSGVCNTLCDLSGRFALKLTVPTTWPATSTLAASSGTFVLWAELQLTQNNNAVSGSMTPCGELIPVILSSPLINEKYKVTLPTAPLDNAPAFPATAVSATLSAQTPGSSIAFANAAWLVGASLADPVGDPWPSRTAITQVDMDADSHVGVTYLYESGNGYTYVPVNTFGTARASHGYLASRVVFSLNGTLSSCSQASGQAQVAGIDAHTLGCQLAGGSNCTSTQANYLDTNIPGWQPGTSSYTLMKVAANATCADVRAALP